MNTEHLALIAGAGDLPTEILRGIKASGAALPRVYLLSPDTEPYEKLGVEIEKINNPMAIAMILTKMRLAGIRRMMMAGRVPKKNMYSRESLDSGARTILSHLGDRNDHNLLAGVVNYVEKFGIRVVSYEQVIPEMMASAGHIAGPAPNENQTQDRDYGIEILKKLLPLSFGQSLIVSDRAVVAVEAMEGTDEMIRRAGTLAGRGVLIKGIRADQDRRYDIPVVGPETLNAMSRSGLQALFIEEGSVLILRGEEFRARAAVLKISVCGVERARFNEYENTYSPRS